MKWWTSKNLTEDRRRDVVARALAASPGGRTVSLSSGKRIYLDVHDASGAVVKSFRVDRGGQLRPWLSHWRRP